MFILLRFIFSLFIWLHWVLSCSMQDLVPDQESNPGPLHWELRVLATGPPGKSVQFSSVAQSCPTLCDPMNCSTPGLPVHHQLPEPAQTNGSGCSGIWIVRAKAWRAPNRPQAAGRRAVPLLRVLTVPEISKKQLQERT